MATPLRFRLLLPRSIYDAMVAQAEAELPAECCGVLAGRRVAVGEPGADATVEVHYPLRNELQSPTECQSDGRAMLDASRDWEKRGLEVLAVYHSHPSTLPIPSKKDLDWNYSEQVITLILSLAGPTPELRGWWLWATGYEEAEWEVV